MVSSFTIEFICRIYNSNSPTPRLALLLTSVVFTTKHGALYPVGGLHKLFEGVDIYASSTAKYQAGV